MDKENCLEEFYLLILQWLVMAYNFLVASGKSYYLGNVTRFQLLEKNVKEKKKKENQIFSSLPVHRDRN